MEKRIESANERRPWGWRSVCCLTVVGFLVVGSFSTMRAGAQDDGGQTDPPTDSGGGGDSGGTDAGGGSDAGSGGDSQGGGDTGSSSSGGGSSRPSVSGWGLAVAGALVLVAIVIVLQRGTSGSRRPKPESLYDSYDSPLARTESPMTSSNDTEQTTQVPRE